jgi:predicted nucleic acid-binding protein
MADRSDRHHRAAADAFVGLAGSRDLVTTDHVVVETWMLLRARLGRAAAIAYWDAMDLGLVRVHGVTSENFRHARRIVEAWPDQDFSLVDCTSFAAMEALGIDTAFAFDRHFRVYRYGSGRRRAIDVVP